MKITVFGASGNVGQLVVEKLLKDGHEVVAFVHGKSPFAGHKNLQIIIGDVHDINAVDKAMAGSVAIISTLGSWGTKTKDIMSAATHNIVELSRKHKVSKFISVTGADARAKQDQIGLIHRLSHFTLGILARKVLVDGEKHIAILEKSNITWTVIRSPIMTSGGNKKSKLSAKRPLPWATVNRIAVAEALTTELQSNSWDFQAPYIHRL